MKVYDSKTFMKNWLEKKKTGQVRVGLTHEGFRTVIYKNEKKNVCCMGVPYTYFIREFSMLL